MGKLADRMHRMTKEYFNEKESQYVVNCVVGDGSSVWEKYAEKTFSQFTQLDSILSRLNKLNEIHE